MAALVITAANVQPGAGAQITNGFFGATLTQGQLVYLDETDNRFKLADANSATAAARRIYGAALNAGANGQPGAVQRGGLVNLGATLVVGKTYCLGATPGSIVPIEDLLTGDYVAILGVAKSASQLEINIHNSDTAIP